MASVEEITRIITDAITDALAPIKTDINEMKNDIGSLKDDIGSLKDDMSKVSNGFKVLYAFIPTN
jgi:uncharacterized phage infection (PIP) family protein YhgE